MSSAITNTSPRISRLVARLQAQSSYLPCKMMCFSSCRLLFEHLNVAVHGWGWATMSFFKWGRELMSYFQMGWRDEKGWEPLD